ncbi:MAG: carboxypeptidase M32 [Gammaproteobacteria bacterium]|nr:carboxypeptidase M32 [Gammaproteobacteria bacterium]
MNQAYAELESKIAEIKALDHMMDLSNWDESTNMKPASAPNRAEMVATTAALRQRLIADEGFGELLERAAEGELSDMEAANVRVAERTRKQSIAVPEDLLKESKRVQSECHTVWARNRPLNDWVNTLPSLEAVIRVSIEMSQCLAEAFQLAPYDALMNQYETGNLQSDIDSVFDEIKTFLLREVPNVESDQISPLPFSESFSDTDQLKLAEFSMRELMFDFDRGRLDQSAHPFSCGTANDARLTTRLSANDFTHSLFAVFHETGHARYTQNQPNQWVMQFVGEPTGMAVHESQSLFMEMQICRSDAFLEYIHPMIRLLLRRNGSDASWSLENFKRTVRHVKRDLIRVYSDEMTYPFHIFLRYAIEKQLCNGDLQVKDLPDAWNDGMMELMGIDTRDDFTNGCMQDIHWYEGLFGYFPCYLLGAIFAAQLYQACVRKIGDQTENVRQGDFSAISAWLAENIHSKGSLLEGQTLIRTVTGEELSATSYLSHLNRRYVNS